MIWVRAGGIDSAPLKRAAVGLSYKNWTGVAQSGAAVGCERGFQERIGVVQKFLEVFGVNRTLTWRTVFRKLSGPLRETWGMSHGGTSGTHTIADVKQKTSQLELSLIHI